MRERQRWIIIVGGCALLLGIVLQIPQFLHLMQPESRGILVHLNSDEYQYLARIEEALTGRPEQAAQPYLGDPYIPGLHLAPIEQIEGLLFGWTGWRAATVVQVMDSAIPMLLFFGLFAFFRLAGFSRPRSLVGVFLFIVPLLYSLNRPVHQRTSFLLVLTTILLIQLALERRKAVFAVCGGALLGALVGVYLWSWMIAWSYVGALFVWEAVAWWRMRPRQPLRRSRFGMLLLLVCVGLIVAGFFAVRILHLMQHPLYPQVAFRQGMYLMRQPESWVYSILFLGMSLGLLVAAWRFPKLGGSHRYAILVPVAVWIGMHQQLLHGHVIAFASHFTFAIALGAVCSLLLGSLFFSRRLVIPFLCGAVMLSGTTWDNRHVLKQFSPIPSRFTEQHFSTLLPVLDALPRAVILSDDYASGFISVSTHHDILNSIYLESALMPHEEIARRYCVTHLPLTNEQRQISAQMHLIWPDANAANRGTDAREREVALVERACAEVDADPAAALRQYNVQYVLWDVRRTPEWNVKRLKVPLTQVEEDAGNWVLYRVNGARP